MSQLTARCSALSRTWNCPAAAFSDGFRVVSTGEDSEQGRATHHALAAAIPAGRMTPDLIDEAAARFRAPDAEELARLCWAGWHCFAQVSRWFPEPQTEVELAELEDGLRLTGHADLLSPNGDTVYLGDFKTGFADEDHEPQVRGYGWLGLRRYRQCRTVRAVVLRCRERTADWYVWTRAQLDDWFAELRAKLKEPNSYQPRADTCRYCPRALTCPAKTALIRQASDGLGGDFAAVQVGELLPTDPAERGPILTAVLARAKLVAKVAEQVAELVKADVAAHGGSLPTGDGNELAVERQTQRPVLVTPDSMAIVAAECASDPDYCATLRFSKQAVEKAVKANAARGRKHQAWLETVGRLEEAGCLGEQITERLVVRRALTMIPQETRP